LEPPLRRNGKHCFPKGSSALNETKEKLLRLTGGSEPQEIFIEEAVEVRAKNNAEHSIADIGGCEHRTKVF
jgi:hypothetical protein